MATDRVISIDPGCSHSGVACWVGQTLVAAGGASDLQGIKEVADWLVAERVVLEVPGRLSRHVRLESALKLSEFVGQIKATLRLPTVEFLPTRWKGNLPKPTKASEPYIVTERCKEFLSSAEKETIVVPGSARKRWDVWDAIGIGLVYLERCRRGLR